MSGKQVSICQGLVCLRNQTDSPLYREILRQPPTLLADIRLRVLGVTPGCYRIVRLDTRTGNAQESSLQESWDGVLVLAVPELRHDAAVRFERRF